MTKYKTIISVSDIYRNIILKLKIGKNMHLCNDKTNGKRQKEVQPLEKRL